MVYAIFAAQYSAGIVWPQAALIPFQKYTWNFCVETNHSFARHPSTNVAFAW